MMKKKLYIFCLFGLMGLVLVSITSSVSTYNFLTKGYADTLYCSISSCGGGGGGSSATFLGLNDTPSSYVGSNGYCVTVNSSATGLNFTPCASGGSSTDTQIHLNPPYLYNISGEGFFNETKLNETIDARDTGATTFLELTDTPSSYIGQGGKTVKVDSLGLGIEFVVGVVNTIWDLTPKWFYNNSGLLGFNETTLNLTIEQVINKTVPVNQTILIRYNNTDQAFGTTSRTYIDPLNLSEYDTTNWKALTIHGDFYKIYSGKQLHNLQIWNCSGDVLETILIDTNVAGIGLDAQTIHPMITYTVPKKDFCFDGVYHFRYQHIQGTEGITKKYTSYEAII